MKTSNASHSQVGLKEFSCDLTLARAVHERLSKIKTRQSREGKSLVRQARELRRKLIEEARSSQ